MIPPPGFVKPIWRGWEQSVVNTNLAVAVTTIERSLGGCHKAKVIREPVHCPSSSNVHHYVRQVPHRCEVLPITPRKKGNGNMHIYLKTIFFSKFFILDISRSEVMRVEMSMEFVAKINRFSCQKAGGFATAPILPKAIGQTMSCMMCVTRGQCLGKNCLGDNGMFIYSFLL